jgi:hypothetical protein
MASLSASFDSSSTLDLKMASLDVLAVEVGGIVVRRRVVAKNLVFLDIVDEETIDKAKLGLLANGSPLPTVQIKLHLFCVQGRDGGIVHARSIGVGHRLSVTGQRVPNNGGWRIDAVAVTRWEELSSSRPEVKAVLASSGVMQRPALGAPSTPGNRDTHERSWNGHFQTFGKYVPGLVELMANRGSRKKVSKRHRGLVFADWVIHTFLIDHRTADSMPLVLDVAGGGAAIVASPLLVTGSVKVVTVDPLAACPFPRVDISREDLAGERRSVAPSFSDEEMVSGSSPLGVQGAPQVVGTPKFDLVEEIERITKCYGTKALLEAQRAVHETTPGSSPSSSSLAEASKGGEEPLEESGVATFSSGVEPSVSQPALTPDGNLLTLSSQYGFVLEAFNNDFPERSHAHKDLLADCTVILGLHPDQATEAIVKLAIRLEKPFAVVPCCVFSNEPQVKTYDSLCTHLLSLHPSIESTWLPFMGRNRVIFATSYGDVRQSPP